MTLAAMALDGGFADRVCAATSSHFCSSERQYRFPLEYGGQRTPTAQWTVTGSGAVILQSGGAGPYITYLTPGRIVDAGITDANNMAAPWLRRHTKRSRRILPTPAEIRTITT